MAVEFDDRKIANRLRGFRDAKQKVKGYDVGFAKSATYTDGTQVASVAAWNEFGTDHIPERPFFRQGNKKAEKKLARFVEMNMKASKNYIVDRQEVDSMGSIHEGEIKDSILDLKEPANKPSTIKAKKSSNPLIGGGKRNGIREVGGTMRNSVTHKVIE